MKPQKYNSEFQTPDSYFENQKRKLHIREGLDFSVPENYFEDQKNNLLKSISQFPKRKSLINMGWVIAASVAIVVSMIWKTNNTKRINPIALHQASEILAEVYIESPNFEILTPDISIDNSTNNSTKPKEQKESIEKKENISEKSSSEEAIKESSELEEKEEVLESIYDIYVDEPMQNSDNQFWYDENSL